MESALRPRVILGEAGHDPQRRVVDTAIPPARGTGVALNAVDVHDHDPRNRHRGGRPPMQDPYHALPRVSTLSDDFGVRIFATPSSPHETSLHLVGRPGDLLILAHTRRRAPRDTGRSTALRRAAAARCSVVIVSCQRPEADSEASSDITREVEA